MMKTKYAYIFLGILSINSYAADVYEFGHDRRGEATTVKVQSESGFNNASEIAHSDRIDNNDTDLKAETDQNFDGSDCEQKKKVNGYVLKINNNCGKDGKPLVRFGR